MNLKFSNYARLGLILITAFSSLLIPGIILAQDSLARLEIISFSRVSDNTENYSAEVCGIVHRQNKINLGEADLIRLILDKDGRSPRVYYTYAGQTGIFCSLVVTIEGTVEAAIESLNNSEIVKAQINAKGNRK